MYSWLWWFKGSIVCAFVTIFFHSCKMVIAALLWSYFLLRRKTFCQAQTKMFLLSHVDYQCPLPTNITQIAFLTIEKNKLLLTTCLANVCSWRWLFLWVFNYNLAHPGERRQIARWNDSRHHWAGKQGRMGRPSKTSLLSEARHSSDPTLS